MQKITPFLSFPDGNAEEAVAFYVSLLPDSRIDHIFRSPVDTPSGPAGSVLTLDFTLAGMSYVALNKGPDDTFNAAISFMVRCDDQAEVDRLWTALSAGGREIACGWLCDRWGLTWQITPKRLLELIKDADPGRAQRAMKAMMGMVKIDIAEIERAAAGKGRPKQLEKSPFVDSVIPSPFLLTCPPPPLLPQPITKS
jgi:predicted 3-demethylubiquinone-9 3-methyltransferase (glyoxalase superfamily)